MRFSEEEKDIVRELLAFEYKNQVGGIFLKEISDSRDWKDSELAYAYLFWCNKRPEELVAYLAGEECESILCEKLKVLLFLKELAKERLVSFITQKIENSPVVGFIWGPYKFLKENKPQDGRLYIVPDGKELKIENANGYIDLETNEWLCPTAIGLPAYHRKEIYLDDVCSVWKILNSRIFVSEELRTLAENNFETVADRSLKVSQSSIELSQQSLKVSEDSLKVSQGSLKFSKWSIRISWAALFFTCIATCLTCISTCDTHTQINNAREQANSAVDISKRDSVALEDLKNFEVTTEGYLKRNDSIMSSILNILNTQTEKSDKQTSKKPKK